jgi:hypothetical protein
MLTMRRLLVLLATLAGAGLVACSGGDDGESLTSLSADEILEKARQAVSEAKSVRVSGDTVEDDGTKLGIDYQISQTGTTGTVTVEGATFEILVTGEDFLMKGDKEAWTTITGEAGAGEVFAGRWVKVPTDDEDFEDLEGLADWGLFVEKIFTPDGSFSKGETKQIDGVEVIGLVDDGKDGGTLWIPVHDEPLPVQGIDEDGLTIEFRDWGKPVTIQTPPADEVIDLAKLAS